MAREGGGLGIMRGCMRTDDKRDEQERSSVVDYISYICQCPDTKGKCFCIYSTVYILLERFAWKCASCSNDLQQVQCIYIYIATLVLVV